MYEAKIIEYSVAKSGVRLITFEVCYPHAIHKDIMTHRWARNFQSFRAYPPEKVIENIQNDPFIPEVFNGRVKGMGEGPAVRGQDMAIALWMDHVNHSVTTAQKMTMLGLAKAQVNFVIQDLAFIRGVITTTMPKLFNFFNLRTELDSEGKPKARPEVYKIAIMMREAYMLANPTVVEAGEWHLPYVTDDDRIASIDQYFLADLSAARCARVSYLTHDGKRDLEADIRLAKLLKEDGHMSPFEHQGRALFNGASHYTCGTFEYGWRQYRKLIPGESLYHGEKEDG